MAGMPRKAVLRLHLLVGIGERVSQLCNPPLVFCAALSSQVF